MSENREQRLGQVFVELADTLVDDFDVLDFLGMLVDRCVELLEVSAAGVVLVDQRGGLRMAAASSEAARLVEVFAVQADDGPCLDCVRSGRPVSSPDLAAEGARWPRFALVAHNAGFHAAHAVPMRLRHNVIGALNLLNVQSNGVEEASVALGQALADVATIGMLQQRSLDHSAVLTEQLQTALNSRVVIEQAKGVLAAHAGVDMEQAFTMLRGHARARSRRISELARSVAEGTADLTDIATTTARPTPHAEPERH